MLPTEDASSQVGEILEVLNRLRQATNQGRLDLRKTRLDAQRAVATARGIAIQSVQDKCTRKLDITTERFDELVAEWLEGGAALARLVESKKASRPPEIDLEIIREFFAEGQLTEPDAEVAEDDALSRPNEELFDDESAGEEIDDRLRAGDFTVPDSWGRRKVRKGQRAWRRLVIANFRGACAICGLNAPVLLEAAHIRGWARDVQNRLNPANGYALCRLHHRAYDKKLLRIVGGQVAIDRARLDLANEAVQRMIGAFDAQPVRVNPIRPVLSEG